jgi:hypothetical protein
MQLCCVRRNLKCMGMMVIMQQSSFLLRATRYMDPESYTVPALTHLHCVIRILMQLCLKRQSWNRVLWPLNYLQQDVYIYPHMLLQVTGWLNDSFMYGAGEDAVLTPYLHVAFLSLRSSFSLVLSFKPAQNGAVRFLLTPFTPFTAL